MRTLILKNMKSIAFCLNEQSDRLKGFYNQIVRKGADNDPFSRQKLICIMTFRMPRACSISSDFMEQQNKKIVKSILPGGFVS